MNEILENLSDTECRNLREAISEELLYFLAGRSDSDWLRIIGAMQGELKAQGWDIKADIKTLRRDIKLGVS